MTAADGLASLRRDAAIMRPASGIHLDEQQQGAYAVPGAGYNVCSVSVVNSAVAVLRRETDVPARSVAAELYEWGEDRIG
jgi:hypothetical protein